MAMLVWHIRQSPGFEEGFNAFVQCFASIRLSSQSLGVYLVQSGRKRIKIDKTIRVREGLVVLS